LVKGLSQTRLKSSLAREFPQNFIGFCCLFLARYFNNLRHLLKEVTNIISNAFFNLNAVKSTF
jgi:hypothetical protein